MFNPRINLSPATGRSVSMFSVWAVGALLIGFSFYSMFKIGLTMDNFLIFIFAGTQCLVGRYRAGLALKMVGIEMLLIVFLSMPLMFADFGVSVFESLSFFARVCIFAFEVIVLVFLSAVCLDEASRLRRVK